MKAAFTAITKYHNKVAQETMVLQLIDGIQVQNNLTIKLVDTKVKENKFGNWLGTVSCMETKVSKAFRVAKGNKNQGRKINNRRVSAYEVHGRGHGGRG